LVRSRRKLVWPPGHLTDWSGRLGCQGAASCGVHGPRG
jgi:hypothetical protein